MPYQVYPEGSQYCVHKKRPDGSKGAKVDGGCHATEAKAEEHMSALYAAEKALRRAAEIMHKIVYQ